MTRNALTALTLAAGLGLAISTAHATPPSTAFTYQASLADNGTPANGAKAMQFKLWNAASGGTQAGTTISQAVPVSNGVFTVSLDFTEGKVSTASGQALWLEVIVEGVSLGRTPMTGALYSLSTRGITVNSSGNVGLGTPAPQARLDVHSDSTNDAYVARFRSTALNAAATQYRHTGGTWTLGSDSTGNGQGGNQFYCYDHASASAVLTMQGGSGRIGIGTTAPGAKLETAGAFRVIESADAASNNAGGGAGLEMSYRDADGARISSFNRAGNSPRNLYLNPFGAKVGIGTLTPATTLDVNGAVTIRGGADIVEGFDSSCGTAFEPGTVLVIDPTNPGKLMCSSDAYDAKVAGVVSGANGVQPGIKLGQDGTMDGEIPVAMTGRVYVKCSAENGAIQPGDRLTTASLSGHAMKATDGERCDGAVIGKAMSGLDEGTGMVLVLVNLQ